MIQNQDTDRKSEQRDVSDGISEAGLEVVEDCPLCASSNLDLLFLARDTLHGLSGDWGIHRCQRCRVILTSPRPGRDAMAEFYPADYQPFNAPLEKQDRPPWFEGLRSLAGRFLDTKEHLLPTGLPPGKALEVGCGSGRYLARLAAEGWIVQGLDPSATTVENLRATTGLPVTVGDIDGAEFEVGFFDLIAAVMVLEHLHDPLANIRKLHSWIRPGGYLSGSVPNCGSWEFRFFGRSWYALQVPTHLFHFTPETLTTLLERAGFGDVRIAQQRNVSNLMVHAGRFLARHHLPFSSTFLEFPERGSRMLRYSVRPAASILAWARQAGRISFLARKDDPNTNME